MQASFSRKLLSTIALCALSTLVSLQVRAHHGADQVITAAPAIPTGAAVETMGGTIDVLVVDNRVTGTSTRYTLLRRDDGTVVGLQGASAESLFAGTRVSASGRRAGGTLVADSVSVQGGPPAAASAAPAASGQVQGALLLAHVDDFEHGRGEFRLVVRADNGHSTELRVGVIPDVLRSGMTVVAYGTPSADGLGLDTNRIEVLTQPDDRKLAQGSVLPSFAPHNVLVLLVKFTDNVEPFTSAAVQGVMATGPNSVAAYYSEASFGQQQLNVTVSPTWVQSGIAKPSTCDYSNIGDLADTAYAAAYPNDHTSYQNRFYVFPQLGSCGWAGLAYVGFGLAYSNGYNTLGVFGHELGHNFGLLHAGSLTCTGVPMCSSGAVTEYGDRFDIMGNTNTGGTHFNAAQKSILNWIPLSSVKTYTSGTATYTLSPIESPGGASYAVKIPAGPNRTYWVEYRQPIGFDSALAAYPNNGAQIRVSSPFESVAGADDTELLDMTPATGTFTDAALVAGQSFTDSTYGVTITVGTASPSSLNVTVSNGSGSQATTTTLSSNPNPSPTGTNATFTATVSGNGPTGTVNFKDGGSSIGGCSAVALTGSGNNKTAACTTSGLAAGTHSITATYSGDASNTASTSAALSQTVSAIIQSSTTIASSLNPSTSGSAVTFTATVTGAAGLTGSVNFDDGVNSIAGCSAMQLPAGAAGTKTATCTTSTLTVGTHTINAFYGGDVNNVPSSTAKTPLSQVVNAGGLTPTTTTLASSSNPSTFGGSVTLTATVTGSGPTGSVNFKDGASSIAGCSAAAVSAGRATCATSALSAATHSITAAYGGDGKNAASTSAALSQVVNKAVSTTALASSANPSTFGNNVTFTATVAGVAPTGSVNFKDGAGSIAGCSAVALAGSGNSRTAACTISGLTVTTHSISAAYGGDGGNGASTSTTVSQVVNKAVSTTVLGSSSNPSTFGASVTFTATVTGIAPTGSVNFKDGASSIANCSATAVSGSGNARTASCTINTLSVATHSITAAYSGDGSNGASTSATLSQVVNSAGPTGTTTVLASSLNPSTFGAGVTFTATVTGNGPTGSVNFKDGASSIAGCSAMALSAGTASCTTTGLSVATHSITAVYGGDAKNAASTSAALSQVVNSAGSSINVALATNGGVATASSSYSAAYPVSAINNNDRAGTNWGNGGGWNDGTRAVFPDWVQINFNGSKTIDRVVVYTLQDNYPNPVEPSDTMTFTTYGVTDFTVQGWNGASWVTLGSVSGNNLVKRTVSFAAYTTDRIRINVTGALLNYSRITEVEAWGTAAAGPSASTTTLASTPNPATLGTSISFTATVSGVGPTGTVNFKDGAGSIANCGSVALTGSGNTRTAQCATSALASGTHSITAAYAGDSGNTGSTSTAVSQVVNSGGGGEINVALASNGGVASASSSFSAGFPASAINNNERAGVNWGNGGGWNDATAGAFPDWVRITFNTTRTIDHVVVYTVQDNYGNPVEPTDTMTFSLYGITAFTVQAKQGTQWTTLGTVSGNNLVKRTVSFAPFATNSIRIMVNGALASFSRITEVEAWGN